MLEKKDLAQMAKANPFPTVKEGKELHLFFLEEEPSKADMKGMEALKTDSESFKLIGKAFYFHAPDGIHRSKLAAKLAKFLGVTATARNWNTVLKLLEMAD